MEEVEEDDVSKHVKIKIAIVQRMEQHHQRPEDPHRRYKQRPPDQKTTQNTLTIGNVFQLWIRCARVAHQCKMAHSVPQR